MLGERYTLVLRHELVDETGVLHQLDKPLTICYTMFDVTDRKGTIYCVNNMLHQMEHEFLKRMDGGADNG